jgi:hypothetical protein
LARKTACRELVDEPKTNSEKMVISTDNFLTVYFDRSLQLPFLFRDILEVDSFVAQSINEGQTMKRCLQRKCFPFV